MVEESLFNEITVENISSLGKKIWVPKCRKFVESKKVIVRDDVNHDIIKQANIKH